VNENAAGATRPVSLRTPTRELLPRYVAALERGWSPDNVRRQKAVDEELAQVAADPQAFVDLMVDREAKGPPVTLPDGTIVPRLPGYRLWIWEDDFCGSIGLRWQRGTNDLPPHVLGHVGYAVVPWKRDRGVATAALALMLGHARREGLAWVELTTDEENAASRKVIVANGGTLVGPFRKPAMYGGAESLRYRIKL
jgi:predicted acetyltransferase